MPENIVIRSMRIEEEVANKYQELAHKYGCKDGEALMCKVITESIERPNPEISELTTKRLRLLDRVDSQLCRTATRKRMSPNELVHKICKDWLALRK